MVIKVDFEVVGEEKMHCSACEARVKFALSRLHGVREVLASAKTQRIVVVISSEQVTTEEVQTRLKDAGFETALTTS